MTQTSSYAAVPVTEILAKFAHDTQFHDLPAEVPTKLKELLLDYIGVSAAASIGADSTEPIYQGILSFAGGSSGSNTVFKRGQQYSPPVAALLNGALSHSYDFDDTFARGCLHPGTAVIPATLAQAESLHSSTQDVLAALAVGYEVVCRVGTQLSDGGYERGFHNTSTAGIFGCVAAIASLQKLPAAVIETAFGMAGSKASGSMQFLENGSWNKRLHPGFAAYDAFLCVHLAEAGVLGAAKPLEGRFGAFHAFSSRTPDLEGLTQHLGVDWQFLGTALKPFAACRMTHGAIDLASDIAASAGRENVDSITVSIRQECVNIVGLPAPNKIHPENIVEAQFSIYYQVAVAWFYGASMGWAVYDKLHDERVRQLSERITVVADQEINGLETKLAVKYTDGTCKGDSLLRPLGEESNPFTKDRVDQKFFGLASPVYGDDTARLIKDLVDGFEGSSVGRLMDVVK